MIYYDSLMTTKMFDDDEHVIPGYNVGDLVRFNSYYDIWMSPRMYISPNWSKSNIHYNSLGIIIKEITTGEYAGLSYVVYWFNTRRVTETFAAYLKAVY